MKEFISEEIRWFSEETTSFRVAFAIIMVLLLVSGVGGYNFGIFLLLFWVGMCTLFQAKGWPFGEFSRMEDKTPPWDKEKTVRRCCYIFAPFVAVLIIVNTGPHIFGLVWSHWGLRLFFVLLGSIVAISLVRWKGPVAARMPDKEQYRQKLDEIRELKAKSSPKFSMRAKNPRNVTFPNGELGVVVNGTIEQGTIRDGDQVQVRGREEAGKFKVYEVVCRKGSGVAVAGQAISLAIVGDVKSGDIVERV